MFFRFQLDSYSWCSSCYSISTKSPYDYLCLSTRNISNFDSSILYW